MVTVKTKLTFFGLLTASITLLLTASSITWVLVDKNIAQTELELKKDIQTVKTELESSKKRFLSAARQTAELEELGLKVKHISRYKSSYNPDVTKALYTALSSAAYDSGKIAGNIWKTSIYDYEGDLVAFSHIEQNSSKKGYAHNFPKAELLISDGKTKVNSVKNSWENHLSYQGFDIHYDEIIPSKQTVRYSTSDSILSIKSFYPIMGLAFNKTSRKMEPSQVGFVMNENPIDRLFLEKLKKLIPNKEINIYLYDNKNLSLTVGTLKTYTSLALKSFSKAQITKSVEIENSAYLQIVLPLYENNQIVGTIVVLQIKKTLLDYFLELFDSLIFVIFIIILITLPISISLVRTLTRPIERLQEGIREIRSGNLGKQIKVYSKDEVGHLTISFNEMSTDLAEFKATIEERERALKISQKELEHLSHYDFLTNLPNRRLFMLRLEHAIEYARRDKSEI
ncbi:MAG: HAMP domain-containing protein, partial [Campylobacterota bacterium]|nr:HAMP domain-containing protein [Campylobacterota bacterium]